MNKILTVSLINYPKDKLFTTFRWLVLAGLLFVAINLNDPHLLAYRQFETPALLIMAASGIAFYFRRPDNLNRTVGLSVLLATIVLVVLGEYSFHFRKNLVLNEIDETTLQLGEHFIVGYHKVEELKPLVSKGLVAGIFVTQRNVEGKSSQDFRNEIHELQQLRKNARLPPLIVTTDQEGGIVSRLSPPLTRTPPLASILNSQLTKAELRAKAEAYGREQGQALTGLGITVNFSPVVDLKNDRAGNRLDFHSLINQRAISGDPAMTTEVALAYIRGLESQGVKGTLKHFPGLGGVTNDTHHFSAKLGTAVSDLEARDWLPFKQIAKDTDALIMLSHVILTAIDSKNPVSFSKAVVQRIIRDSWQHNGVLVTDDLTMGAAYNEGLCRATLKALNAGVDLLLISYDYEKFYEAMHCARRAYAMGQLDRRMAALSHQRMVRLFER